MPHDGFLDDVAAYAVGALPASEVARVEHHLRTCLDCQREYGELQSAVTSLAWSAQADPSPLLKQRILKQASPRYARRVAWPAASIAYAIAAACLLFAVFAGLRWVTLNAQLNQADLRIRNYGGFAAALTQPGAQRYRFGSGTLVAAAGHLYIALPDLVPPPPGKVYQAWTLPKGSTKMAPSLTFVPQPGVTVVDLPVAAQGVAAVAVSVEPAGGSLQPTSRPIAIAKML